jgi:hypothetical protein
MERRRLTEVAGHSGGVIATARVFSSEICNPDADALVMRGFGYICYLQIRFRL